LQDAGKAGAHPRERLGAGNGAPSRPPPPPRGADRQRGWTHTCAWMAGGVPLATKLGREVRIVAHQVGQLGDGAAASGIGATATATTVDQATVVIVAVAVCTAVCEARLVRRCGSPMSEEGGGGAGELTARTEMHWIHCGLHGAVQLTVVNPSKRSGARGIGASQLLSSPAHAHLVRQPPPEGQQQRAARTPACDGSMKAHMKKRSDSSMLVSDQRRHTPSRQVVRRTFLLKLPRLGPSTPSSEDSE
jgi:hypothetical protein